MTELNIFNTYASKDFDVYFQGEAFLDSEVDICYLRYGEDEIGAYVNDVIKPEMIEFFNEKKAEIGSYHLDIEGNLLCLKGTNVQESSVDLSGLSLDDRYMTLNSQQNIAAVKTFLSNPVVSNNLAPAIALQNTSVLFGSAPEEDQISNVNFTESTGTVMGSVSHKVGADASVEVGLCCSNLEASESSEIAIGYDEYGEVYTKAPTPASADNSTNIATTAYVKNNLANKADADLSNLSSDGQLVVDTHNGTISNCVLEIPQKLNVSIASNVVTLAGGSVVTLTGATYATYTLAAAQTYTISGLSDGKYYLFTNYSGVIQAPVAVGDVVSASSLPASGNYCYLTSDNLIYQYSSGWSATSLAYPIAMIDVESGVASLDIVFNGAGYIGHHAFVYPNIKLLTPNGYNADGTLKSSLETTSALQISELSGSNNSIDMLSGGTLARRNFKEVETLDNTWNGAQYVKSENMTYLYSGGNYVVRMETPIVSYVYTGSNVTSFAIVQPVKVATIDMLGDYATTASLTSGLAGKQDTLVSGTSIKTINSTSLLGSGNISLLTSADIANMQTTTNLVTSVSSASTDSQYPSAKLLYDTVGNIETLLHNINSGS